MCINKRICAITFHNRVIKQKKLLIFLKIKNISLIDFWEKYSIYIHRRKIVYKHIKLRLILKILN